MGVWKQVGKIKLALGSGLEGGCWVRGNELGGWVIPMPGVTSGV